jgi:hypothetical protein
MHSFGAKEWADKCEQLDATIADLQGQIAVERANKESAVACVDRDVKKISALQQRVAQLEMDNRTYINERHENMKTIEALQADHATLLGLLAQVTEIADMMLKGTECEHDVGLCSCEHRRIVKQAQRSLPAQPAQGGVKCVWVDDEGGIYQTGCKHAFMVDPDSDEPPIWIKFCCYCGSLVEFFVPDAEGETRA